MGSSLHGLNGVGSDALCLDSLLRVLQITFSSFRGLPRWRSPGAGLFVRLFEMLGIVPRKLSPESKDRLLRRHNPAKAPQVLQPNALPVYRAGVTCPKIGSSKLKRSRASKRSR